MRPKSSGGGSFMRSIARSRAGHTQWRTGSSAALWTVAASTLALWASHGALAQGKGESITLPTTHEDFFQPGTPVLGAGLPGTIADFLSANECVSCHATYGDQDPFLMNEIYKPWVASMMGQ